MIELSTLQLTRKALCCLAVVCWPGLISGQEAKPVIVTQVIETEISTGYRVVGNVAPLRTTTIGAGTGGRVKEFLVEEGQAIREGQPIATLRTETLEIERRAAEAELELYMQELAEVANGARPEDIMEAEATVAGARAAMEAARNQLKRMQSLTSARASTEADLELARERADFTKANFEASNAALERLRKGARVEQLAQKQAQVDLQKQRILLIKDRLQKHTIIAPFDGFVAAEFTEVGAWISSGDPVAQLIELDQVDIRLPVTANYISRLRIGDKVRVEFPQLPDKLMLGEISRIVPIADQVARTYPVLVRLENEMRDGIPLLMAGMLARVDLPAGSAKRLPLVPKDALVLSQGKRRVFIVEPDPKKPEEGIAKEVAVDLGIASGNLIQVSGKLKAGQAVVIVGNERLMDGQRVLLRFKVLDQ